MNSLSHSMLDFFGKVPILDPILWSNEQQIFPTNFLNESTIEIQLETDRNILLTCALLDYSSEEGLLKEIEHV